jgi:DNA-binding CsgD family transcriptional regulator
VVSVARIGFCVCMVPVSRFSLATGGPDGTALLRESVALARASPGRLELALSLVELGAAERRGNRRAAARGRDTLTPSELRITGLAGSGQSNRQIAQRLFITQKTVETPPRPRLPQAAHRLTRPNPRRPHPLRAGSAHPGSGRNTCMSTRTARIAAITSRQ